MRRLIREPLVYFLLTGAALFLVSEAFIGADRGTIVVTEAERARLADQWQAQTGRPPSDIELNSLVEQWLREEIYYREALAMGLGADGGWQGPVASAYGWHLVHLESRRPPRQPALDEVATRVTADLRQTRRREASEAYYRSLRERYRVVQR